MHTLTIGMLAPDFTLPSITESKVTLSTLRGKKILLSFLRNAQCSICNLWVSNVSKLSTDWKDKGLDVLAIFESTPEKLKQQFQNDQPNFTILSDENGAVHEQFGSHNDEARVNEIIVSGVASGALKEAEACGFAPVMEAGSNFFRMPLEVLIDEQGIIFSMHHATHIFNHMNRNIIEDFIHSAPISLA